MVASVRAYSNLQPGRHLLQAAATQSDGAVATASGEFEVIDIGEPEVLRAKNIIIMLGDGMGASHRTAARIVQNGYTQGKAKQPLAMDTFPYTAMIETASLDTIITDSAPGMQNYVTGNKSASGQEGVWPDDTTDSFDATPAANAVHTSNRGNGTTADTCSSNPSLKTCLTTNAQALFNGSARSAGSDYVLPAEVVLGWGVVPSVKDPGRDLIGDFQFKGWTYTATRSDLNAVTAGGSAATNPVGSERAKASVASSSKVT